MKTQMGINRKAPNFTKYRDFFIIYAKNTEKLYRELLGICSTDGNKYESYLKVTRLLQYCDNVI